MSTAEKPQANTLSQLMDVSTIIGRALDETGGELSPEIEQMLELTDQLKTEKVDQYEFVIKRIEAEAEFLKSRAAEFQKAAKARANAVEHIKERIKALMLIHEQTELAGEYVRFVVSPSIPSLIIDSEEMIPKHYFSIVTTTKLDNAAVKKSLQDGIPVTGAHLEENFSLRAFTASNIKQVKGK